MICNNCQQEIGSEAVCPYCRAQQFKEPQPHHLPVGAVIGGRFRIEGVLGEGGFGITYLARNEKLGMPVAVKEYFPHGFSYRNTENGCEVFTGTDDNGSFYAHGKERFLSEAKTLVRFNSEPGVVKVMDFIEENNTAYLIMEYLEGVTLLQYLKQNGTMSADEAFNLLEPVIGTLAKIHAAGIIHRDISPDNIMRLHDGQLKLMDFGAARDFDGGNRSMSVMLKQGYAPEEQYRRNGSQGPWTDVYALCATVYRCITGRTPVDSLDRLAEDNLQKPSELGAAISPAMEGVLLYGLAVRRNDRCQNMTELLSQLERAKQGIAPQKAAPVDDGNYTIAADAVYNPNMTVAANAAYPANNIPANNMPAQNNGQNNGQNVSYQSAPVRQAAGTVPAPAAPEKKPKKKKKKAIVALIVAAAIILSAVGGMVIYNHRYSFPQHTILSAGEHHTVGAKKNGTVLATGNNVYSQCDVGEWKDIIEVAAGAYHTVGLKKDGTVVATGQTGNSRCRVNDWSDITAIAAGEAHTVGLKKDGTVVANGKNTDKQCEVGDWTDIKAIAAGYHHTIGLRKDGTVVLASKKSEAQKEAATWSNIKAVAADENFAYAVTGDGELFKVLCNNSSSIASTSGSYSVNGRSNSGSVLESLGNEIAGLFIDKSIVAMDGGTGHVNLLRNDGTAATVGDAGYDTEDVAAWTGIVAITAGDGFTIALNADGTLVPEGDNTEGQCNVNGWNLLKD